MVYDAAGNVTNDGLGNTYTYDAENRVISMSGNNSASYVYDAFGQRVRATISSVPYDFLYSGGRAVDEYTSSGWVWGDAGAAQLAVYANSTTYFSHNDWLGSVRAWSNVSGSSVETCTTMPFGDAQTCTGTAPNSWNYTGLPFDSESGMSHALFRQLSTTQGRWTSSDPAGLGAVDPTNPQTWNRYAYVANNPLSFTDPMGLLLKGPGNTCVGDANGIVCGGDGAGGGGGGWVGGGGGVLGGSDPLLGGAGGAGVDGTGGFCDASGNCQGIAMSPDGTGSDPSNPFGYVGGTVGFGAITLAGPSDMPGSTPIQFGAAAIATEYNAYLTGLATTITTTQLDFGFFSIPISTTTSTDSGYLAFLTSSAPTLSPYAPIPGVNQPISGKPPNPCSYFPNKSCFPKKPPNPLSWQFLTMGNTAMSFWDLVP